MNSLSTPAIEKALTASVHAPAAAVKGNLFEKIGIYLDSGNGIFDAEMLQLLRDVNAYLKHQIKKTSGAFTELQNTLQKINEKLEKIKQKKMQKQAQRANIYAKIAERGRHGENMRINEITSPKGDEKKKGIKRIKEVTVRIKNPEKIEKIKQKNIRKILKKTQNAGAFVTGAKRLPNGNVRFTIKSQRIKNTLQNEQKWTKMVAVSAKIQKQTYTVIAHAMKVKQINATNQGLTISQIIKANENLHRNLNIVKIAWQKKARHEKKTWFFLYIEVNTAKMANRLITENLFDGNEVKECEKFCNGCQVKQCFNCQQYEHIATKCRERTRCGHCAKWHRNNVCPTAKNAKFHKCATCGVQKHETWVPTCEIRMAEKRRANNAYMTRPKFFILQSKKSTPVANEAVASIENDEIMKKTINNATTQFFQKTVSTQTTIEDPFNKGSHNPKTGGKKKIQKRITKNVRGVQTT